MTLKEKISYSNISVLWNDTGIEYPDTYLFAEKIINIWNLNLITSRPNKSFWEIVTEYGFPIYSRNSKGKRQIAARKCCYELKKKPSLKAIKMYKWDLYFTGLTKYESRLRMFTARQYGDYFYSKKYKLYKCHPIQNWTYDDIWQYHDIYKIPHNSLYDKDEVEVKGGIRTGCWPCPQALKYGKLKHLRTYYPNLFKILVIKKGLGKEMINIRIDSYRKIKSKEKEYKINLIYKNFDSEKILDCNPCFFDYL
ncbi:MAG: phosphoadenosine phosphosulfate reductase family protein [Promethearchaeota archaeon]